MKIAVVGNGKMGTMLSGLIEKDDSLTLAGMIGEGDLDTLDEALPCDVIIDFSYPGNLAMILEYAVRTGTPAVIGTTGFDEAQEQTIREAAKTVPVVHANNFSLGVNVMQKLVRDAAKALKGFDIEVVETHHRMKKDAPSGTAKTLIRCADPDGEKECVYGRSGMPGARPDREIGVHSLRGGTVAGEHSVYFFGDLEEVEIRHRADSREIFARGALVAAQFATEAKPGYYDMEDVLFGEE